MEAKSVRPSRGRPPESWQSAVTTERYIGVNFDDMDQAMDAFSEYQNTLRKNKGEVISND